MSKNASSHILDMIPGGLAWLACGFALLGAYFTPGLVLYCAAVLAFYSTCRFALAAIAIVRGLHLVRRWESTDWNLEYDRRRNDKSLRLDAVHHIVIIPNYQEEITVLRRTLSFMAAHASAQTSISIVLAMENREVGAMNKGLSLKNEFGSRFNGFLVTLHPDDLVGEIQCKSANLNWAIRQIMHEWVGKGAYALDRVIITVMDADTLWHPQYFNSLGVLFATDEQRYSIFWQAPMRYHGNVWHTAPLMRILHAYATAWELAYLAAPWWSALPMSSYSASLRLLHAAGYWDADAISDEWHMFIKAFFQCHGKLEPVFLPFLANAVVGRTLWLEIKGRYMQTLRHAWGAKEIGYTIAQMARYRSRWKEIFLLSRVSHDNLLAGAGSVIIMFGSQFPLAFHPVDAQALLSCPAFLLLQASAGVMAVLVIIFWVIDIRIRPPVPLRSNKVFLEVLSLPVLALITFCCVTMPVLHAQTLLFLGIPLEFRVTSKEASSHEVKKPCHHDEIADDHKP
jgi:hypothetical protein